MNSNTHPAVDDRPQADQELSLWSLHEKLATLTRELADAAQRTDALPGNDNLDSRSEEPCTPRSYFAGLLQLRRTRERYFGNSLFGEPAWDVMLELMIARIDQREIKMSDLANPNSLGIVTRQYVEALVDAKLVDQFENPENDNDPFLALSSETARRMAEIYRARMRG